MQVFITGGTGLVGARLVRRLKNRGDRVTVLSRDPDAWERVGQDVDIVVGDPTRPGDWQDQLAACDAVVHLAGANLFARRWNSEFKKTIRDSRVLGTENVAKALAASPKLGDGTPKVLISGSAIGYYGPHGDEEITEESPAGSDFMAATCIEWEQATQAAKTAGARVVLLRTGIVHDPRGGALQSLMLPFRLGVGGPVGMALNPKDWGRQYWSWIHYADEIGIILMALDHAAAHGPINATAPNPVRNRDFAAAFGKALGRPAFAPLPALALRVMLGEVAGVIASGQCVLPTKALALGYQFQFPELQAALFDLVKPKVAA